MADRQVKVHVILLDNRFEYDKVTTDRLGEEQWAWLDLAVKRSKLELVDLTVIGAGIQIIAQPHQISQEEQFGW